MQPKGNIMWPVGGIFSGSREHGWHIKIITWNGHILGVPGQHHGFYATYVIKFLSRRPDGIWFCQQISTNSLGTI